jgi:beta-glucanase (GH16 family)
MRAHGWGTLGRTLSEIRTFGPLAIAAWGALSLGGRCGGDEGLPIVPAGAVIWHDDFDGAAGQPPSAANWTYDVGGDGWGNHQLEYDTDAATNVALDGAGHLVITARAETRGSNAYTSARIVTRGLFSQKYGKFSGRMKLPSGPGLWPAFWMLGSNLATASWPACGEIDVMEYRGQEPGVVHGSVHGPGYSGGGAVTKSYSLPGGAHFDDDFHVFAVTWSPDRVVFSVDDVAYQTVTPADLNGSDWVFDHPFFIILNVAVGGDYVGPPTSATKFPTQLVVDWVKVEAVAS